MEVTKMKKIVLSCALLIAALAIHANMVFANDCVVGRSPEGVYPMTDEDIIMVDEDIRVYPLEGRAECTFEFLNTGEEKDVLMGFPCERIPDPDSILGDTSIRDFTAEDESGVLKVESDNGIKPPKSFDSRFDDYSSWFTFSVHFKKGQRKIIKNTYKFSMSKYSTGTDFVGYIIKTGSVWKDNIGHTKVTFYIPGLQPYWIEHLIGGPYFRFEEDKIIWERSDFEPVEDLGIYFMNYDKLINFYEDEIEIKNYLIEQEEELSNLQDEISQMGKDKLLNLLLDIEDYEIRDGFRFYAYERLLKIDRVYGQRICLKVGENRAIVNGMRTTVDNDDYGTFGPLIKDDRTFVPLRFIAENMGGKVEWDGALKQIKISYEGKTVKMQIGQKTYYVGNEIKTMDTAPEIVNSRTIVPLRFVSESLGYDVQWFDEEKKILISGKKDFPELGFRLMEDELIGGLALYMEDKECIKIIGEAEEKSKTFLTYADLLEHQTWFYKSKGIELDMIRDDDNKQVINSIVVTKPCNFKLRRNIGIGSTRNEVLTAYGEFLNNECDENGSVIVLGTVYGGVILRLENDTVTRIFIGAAAE